MNSLEIASDGLLRANSLSMAIRGLLDTTGVIVVVTEKFRGFISNIGRMGIR